MSDRPCVPGPEGITELLAANHRRFLDFLTSRVGNRDDAEEILQGAFVRSVEKSSDIRDSESAIAWFYRLLRNAVVDHHRRAAAGKRSLEAIAREVSEGDSSMDPAIERALCQCVSALVPTLKPEYADLIARIDLGGEDLALVAESLGIEPGNARVRLHRARTALRASVERTCRTCAEHGCLDCTCAPSERPPDRPPGPRGCCDHGPAAIEA